MQRFKEKGCKASENFGNSYILRRVLVVDVLVSRTNSPIVNQSGAMCTKWV